jgi:hypothetical protein
VSDLDTLPGRASDLEGPEAQEPWVDPLLQWQWILAHRAYLTQSQFEAFLTLRECGTIRGAARRLGIPHESLLRRLDRGAARLAAVFQQEQLAADARGADGAQESGRWSRFHETATPPLISSMEAR